MVILPVGQASTEASISIVIWVMVLVVLLIPAAAATLWLRRWVHQDTGQDSTVGFTLHDVQEMFKRGELDEAQYDRLRQEILARSRQGLDPKAKPARPKGGT